MDGQLLEAENFLLPKNVFLVRQFLASDTKKTTNCHSALIKQIQPRTIFTKKRAKTERKNGQIKIISFVFPFLFFIVNARATFYL